MIDASFTGEILVVDDSPPIREVLSSILNRAGHKVFTASNGNDAIEAMRQSPPDLVLLDIFMPDVDGFEVCRRFKAAEETASIPVVFTVAWEMLRARFKLLNAGE